MPKLKVYRTPIGFHDAYVAAPSQKAALQAWGSQADLFARGIAEVVTDEMLTAEPLASPGAVIRRLRGTADEQLAAAKMPAKPKHRSRNDSQDQGESMKRAGSADQRKFNAKVKAAPLPPPLPPKPDRSALDAAEKSAKDAQARHEVGDRDWRKRREALDEERRQMDVAHESDRKRVTEDEDRARLAYDKVLAAWKAST